MQKSEFNPADPRRVRQDCLEYRLQVSRRARDDLEYLRGRRLLLNRLGELTGARLKLLLQLARVRLELLFRRRLSFLRQAMMTQADRAKLRIRRSEHSTSGPLLC